MAHQCTSIALDQATKLSDLITATAANNRGTVDGAAQVVDVGGYAEFDVVVDWTSIDVADATETYEFRVEAATTSAFSSTYIIGRFSVGRTAATGQPVATPSNGRVVLHLDNLAHTSASFSGQQDPLRFIRINCVTGGTTPSITFAAWLTAKQ